MDFENTETVTFGCGIDTYSNTMVFTRNGKHLARPFYLKRYAALLEKQTPQPTIHVLPKCDIGMDLKLPPIKLAINYGATAFHWKSDLKELFQTMKHETSTWEPPKVSIEPTLLTFHI